MGNTKSQTYRDTIYHHKSNYDLDRLILSRKNRTTLDDCMYYDDPLDVYKRQLIKKRSLSYKIKVCMKKLFNCHKKRYLVEEQIYIPHDNNYYL